MKNGREAERAPCCAWHQQFRKSAAVARACKRRRRSLTHLLAATLLGGELPDTAASVAVDASGMVIVGGYTDSKALPTRGPFQESFSSRSGFVPAFDANLSNLRFSTYLGDGRPFAAHAAVPTEPNNHTTGASPQPHEHNHHSGLNWLTKRKWRILS